MADLTLSISFTWNEEPGDCTPCEFCKEPIYLKKYVPVIQIGPSVNELRTAYCESCYKQIEDGDI